MRMNGSRMTASPRNITSVKRVIPRLRRLKSSGNRGWTWPRWTTTEKKVENGIAPTNRVSFVGFHSMEIRSEIWLVTALRMSYGPTPFNIISILRLAPTRMLKVYMHFWTTLFCRRRSFRWGWRWRGGRRGRWGWARPCLWRDWWRWWGKILLNLYLNYPTLRVSNQSCIFYTSVAWVICFLVHFIPSSHLINSVSCSFVQILVFMSERLTSSVHTYSRLISCNLRLVFSGFVVVVTQLRSV